MPGAHRPKTIDDPPPWQAVVIPLLLLAVAWALAAARLAIHGDDTHQSFADTTCLSGAPVWAIVQAAVAVLGILSLVATAAAWCGRGSSVARARPAQRAAVRRPAAGATVAAVVWLLLMTLLDPRADLGGYGGCGLG